MMRSTVAKLLMVGAFASCWSSPSHAQPAPASTTSRDAQRAFDEGMALMKAGQFDEACIKLEESQRIEAGMGTQFRLAQCYEKAGRIASAWRNYDAVATSARAARLRASDESQKQSLQKRESYSQKRADALVAKVSRAAIRVPSDVVLLTGLAVVIDGAIVPPASWGDVPLDKGTHRVEVKAEGKKPFLAEVTIIDDGERISVQVPPLQEAPATPDPEPEVVVITKPGDGSLHPVAIAGIAVGILGLGGMGAGVGLGFVAKSKHDDSAPFCNGDSCQQQGLDIRDDARGVGNIGTGVFIAGAVLAAGGIGLLVAGLSMGDDEELDAALTLTPTGGSLRLSW